MDCKEWAHAALLLAALLASTSCRKKAEVACTAGELPRDGTCYLACNDDSDCDEALACENSVCKPPAGAECKSDAECPAPGPCELSNGCQRGHCDIYPCTIGYECIEGVCYLRLGLGASCQGAEDGCSPGLKCDHGVCCDAAAETCCATSATCLGGLACDTEVHSCMQSCTDGEDSQCADPSTTVCASNTCIAKRDLGASCDTDGQCLSGHCAKGASGSVCCESSCDTPCQACSDLGVCDQTPADDPTCGIVACSLLSDTCRTYQDITSYRCAGFGECKVVGVVDCTDYVDAPETTLCRPAQGGCDIEDHCDGKGSCPDAIHLQGFVCRPALSELDGASCDVAETCTGQSKQCPDDVVKLSGTECRPRAAACPDDTDCCDLADVCDGASGACPNLRRATGAVCREAQGGCDLVETCGSTGDLCPDDAVMSNGSACDCYASGPTCDGVSTVCPSGTPVASGSACDGQPGYLCRQCDGSGSCSLVMSEGTRCGWTPNGCPMGLCPMNCRSDACTR